MERVETARAYLQIPGKSGLGMPICSRTDQTDCRRFNLRSLENSAEANSMQLRPQAKISWVLLPG
jgi:hypothetical protein